MGTFYYTRKEMQCLHIRFIHPNISVSKVKKCLCFREILMYQIQKTTSKSFANIPYVSALLLMLFHLFGHSPPSFLIQYWHNPMNCSPPGSSIHGIHQARILEWVARPTSRESSQPRDQTSVFCVFCIEGRFFTAEPLGKPQSAIHIHISPLS